jgi:hypothetical protein
VVTVFSVIITIGVSRGVGERPANAMHCGRINTEPRCNLATQLFGAAE